MRHSVTLSTKYVFGTSHPSQSAKALFTCTFVFAQPIHTERRTVRQRLLNYAKANSKPFAEVLQ